MSTLAGGAPTSIRLTYQLMLRTGCAAIPGGGLAGCRGNPLGAQEGLRNISYQNSLELPQNKQKPDFCQKSGFCLCESLTLKSFITNDSLKAVS